MEFAPDRKPFERQPGESGKAWRAFLFYRDMGDERTLREASKSYHESINSKAKPESTMRSIATWSSRWQWVVRCEEYDRELDKARRREAIREVRDMRQRHITLAQNVQELAAVELEKWLKRARDNPNSHVAAVVDILKAMKTGVEVERAARGEPTEIHESRHKITTEEKRDSMKALLGDTHALEQIDSLINKVNKHVEPEELN
jgi:hypothetical protein